VQWCCKMNCTSIKNCFSGKQTYLSHYLSKTHILTNSMEQSPSREANRSSATQEIPCVLWNLKVHYRTHKSPPPVPILSFKSYQRISPGLSFCIVFRNMVIFYGEELLAPRPTPKLEDHPLSAVRDCIFAATFHIRRPFLHPQPEDAPCRGDRDRLAELAIGCKTEE
jgi:hypothetical protein